MPSSPQPFKHRILTCLNKLSDRDTHSSAVTELQSIAKTLTHKTIPPFLSSISSTNPSDKSPVRTQCVHLISTLSQTHGNILSPHLSKLISAIIRRLPDPDTSVRTACIASTTSIVVHVTNPPFISVAKPYVDALFTEQDINSQTGAALCLAAVINGAPNPDTGYLKRLLPKMEKLLRSNGFKGKVGLLRVVMGVVRVGCGLSEGMVGGLVKGMVELVVKSEDWMVRKGAAEVLEVLAVVEKEMLSGYKAECLKTFEAKRFDKVKGVRETMNQMIEAWNAVQDVPEEVSPPSDSHSFKEEADVQNAPRTPQITNKRTVPSGSSTSTATRRSSFESTSRKTGPAMFRKLDRKKLNDPKLATTEGQRIKPRSLKQETKRALFDEISDEKMPESQYHEHVSRSGVARSNPDMNIDSVRHDSEDLSLIRNQLVQIETQQSNLFDLLEKYIGSSEDGMRSLESRVRGLESTLDEISYDLAKSTGQRSNHKPTLCCRLPGADLLSSKLWKKSEIQPSNTRYASSSSSVKNNVGFRLNSGGSGLIKNPLAEVHQM